MLLKEFQRRKRKNPGYSVRAFARDLGISPGHLSHLMTGKRKLTYVTAVELIKKFGLSQQECELILSGLKSAKVANDLRRRLSRPSKDHLYRDLNVLKLSAEKYLNICHWHHDAIFHLLLVDCILEEEVSILAGRLSLSVSRVRECISNLERVGVISVQNGRIMQKAESYHMDARKKEVAIQKLRKAYQKSQEELMKKAVKFLSPSAPKAILTSHYISIPEESFAEYADLILSFAISLEALSKSKKDSQGQVHALMMQLFPLSSAC